MQHSRSKLGACKGEAPLRKPMHADTRAGHIPCPNPPQNSRAGSPEALGGSSLSRPLDCHPLQAQHI